MSKIKNLIFVFLLGAFSYSQTLTAEKLYSTCLDVFEVQGLTLDWYEIAVTLYPLVNNPYEQRSPRVDNLTLDDLAIHLKEAANRLRKNWPKFQNDTDSMILKHVLAKFVDNIDRIKSTHDPKEVLFVLLQSLSQPADYHQVICFLKKGRSETKNAFQKLKRMAEKLPPFGSEPLNILPSDRQSELEGVKSRDGINWLKMDHHPNGYQIEKLSHKNAKKAHDLELSVLRQVSSQGEFILSHGVIGASRLFNLDDAVSLPKTADIISLAFDKDVGQYVFNVRECKSSEIFGGTAMRQIQSTVLLLQKHFPQIPIGRLEIIGSGKVLSRYDRNFYIPNVASELVTEMEIDDRIYRVHHRVQDGL